MKQNFGIKLFLALLLGMTGLACASNASGNQNAAGNGAATNAAAPDQGAGSAAAVGQSTQAAPEALVADLYKQHDAKKSPFFQDKDRALVDKYFTKRLADLIWKDATRPNSNEVGVLDGDPLYNAQDYEIKNLKVGKGEIKGTNATVVVNFDNFGKKQTLVFSLAKDKTAWKIDNIDYGQGMDLFKWLNDEYSGKAEEGPTAEFEGKYLVGDTTCTVKPVKMAFEVKWAKGSGVEMFFSQGMANDKFIFSSDPKTGKANSFSFDDENYNTGIFYRADGKEFPIKRAK